MGITCSSKASNQSVVIKYADLIPLLKSFDTSVAILKKRMSRGQTEPCRDDRKVVKYVHSQSKSCCGIVVMGKVPHRNI